MARESVFVVDTRKNKTRKNAWCEYEEKNQHDKELKDMIKWANTKGGEEALENE